MSRTISPIRLAMIWKTIFSIETKREVSNMDYTLMFFSDKEAPSDGRIYDLLCDCTRYADANGFKAVWTPERHFAPFGGMFPNPGITSAALATITDNVQLRAGSLISPLHHAVRIAENWSMVDNFSHGRAALSFGSGWNVNDFVFFPENYEVRQKTMYEQIETVRKLWRGESITLPNSYGKNVTVNLFPRPIQDDIPIWVTSSGNPETFMSAGAIGANLLTHLIGQDFEKLAEKIALYRQARADHGYDPNTGIVSLMLHTFMGADEEQVKATVREPFRDYLRTAVKLELQAAQGGGAISGGHRIEGEDIEQRDMESLLDLTFERYYNHGSLMGTPASCIQRIRDWESIEVNEIACLVDFMPEKDQIMTSLTFLAQLAANTSHEQAAGQAEAALSEFLDDFDE